MVVAQSVVGLHRVAARTGRLPLDPLALEADCAPGADGHVDRALVLLDLPAVRPVVGLTTNTNDLVVALLNVIPGAIRGEAPAITGRPLHANARALDVDRVLPAAKPVPIARRGEVRRDVLVVGPEAQAAKAAAQSGLPGIVVLVQIRSAIGALGIAHRVSAGHLPASDRKLDVAAIHISTIVMNSARVVGASRDPVRSDLRAAQVEQHAGADALRHRVAIFVSLTARNHADGRGDFVRHVAKRSSDRGPGRERVRSAVAVVLAGEGENVHRAPVPRALDTVNVVVAVIRLPVFGVRVNVELLQRPLRELNREAADRHVGAKERHLAVSHEQVDVVLVVFCHAVPAGEVRKVAVEIVAEVVAGVEDDLRPGVATLEVEDYVRVANHREVLEQVARVVQAAAVAIVGCARIHAASEHVAAVFVSGTAGLVGDGEEVQLGRDLQPLHLGFDRGHALFKARNIPLHSIQVHSHAAQLVTELVDRLLESVHVRRAHRARAAARGDTLDGILKLLLRRIPAQVHGLGLAQVTDDGHCAGQSERELVASHRALAAERAVRVPDDDTLLLQLAHCLVGPMVNGNVRERTLSEARGRNREDDRNQANEHSLSAH